MSPIRSRQAKGKNDNMEIEHIIIWAAIVISVISSIGIIINRILTKKGIGLRSIQYSIITIMFPLLIILTIQKILPVSTIAVVTGAIIGYAFATQNNKVE